jgi:hypothetical protein
MITPLCGAVYPTKVNLKYLVDAVHHDTTELSVFFRLQMKHAEENATLEIIFT